MSLVPTPAEVMAKATRMLKRVMLLQIGVVPCFLAGGLLTSGRRGRTRTCPPSALQLGPRPRDAAAGCEHHSYHWPVLLVLVGIVGLFVTGYVATRLAVRVPRRRGGGLLAERTPLHGTDGPACTGLGDRDMGDQDMGGGFPGSAGGMPPGFGAGLPPGSRGRRRDRLA